MKKYVKDHQVSTPSVVLQELKVAELDYGATLKQGSCYCYYHFLFLFFICVSYFHSCDPAISLTLHVTFAVADWLKTYKKKEKIGPAPSSSDPLGDIQTKFDDIKRVEKWEGEILHEPLLFPFKLLRGEEARKTANTLGRTKFGEEFYFSFFVSTPALCDQLWRQYFCTEFFMTEGISDDGLQMQRVQFPFYGFDGNGKIANSCVLFPLASITLNHHGRLLGVGGHNKSPQTATDVMDSFKKGFTIIMLKMGRHQEAIDEILINLHILSDDATALKMAVKQHLKETSHGTESSCSGHIMIDGFPKNKPKLKDTANNYERFKNHFLRLLKFPCALYGDIPWRAIKEKWLSLGEKAFCTWFEKEHIEKNPNWRAGSIAIGMPDDNIVESLNEHKFRKLFLAAYRRLEDKNRLPIPVAKALDVLVTELLPSWSKEYETKGFEEDFETTSADRKLAKDFWLDPYFIELIPERLWCARI